MENSIMIGITELRGNIDSSLPLEDRLKISMRGALNHWLVIDEESQFKMANGYGIKGIRCSEPDCEDNHGLGKCKEA